MLDPYLHQEILDCLKLTMETFKKIKEAQQSKQPKADWEIITYKNKLNGELESAKKHKAFPIELFEIHSVKRLV